MDAWWPVLGIVVALGLGWLLFLRSLHRWHQPSPTTPDAKKADVDLSIHRDTGGV